MNIKLYCTDNDKVVDAEIDSIREENQIEAVIGKSIKIRLRYNQRHKNYVGETNGLEFTIKADDIPKEYTYKPFRRHR
tara:strand:- start:243 stop:476 length:234 start_codon:yes stop_codon:yes gene_type:complete